MAAVNKMREYMEGRDLLHPRITDSPSSTWQWRALLNIRQLSNIVFLMMILESI